MARVLQLPRRAPDPDEALRIILEGTATETGTPFFRALVKNLARVLDTHGAWVTEYRPEVRSLRALAFVAGDRWVEDFEHCIDGTPCEGVIEGRRLVHLPDNALELYPNEPDLLAMGAVSYLGVPLLDTDGTVLGHLAVLDNRPIPPQPRLLTVFNIFAARAAAELRRLRAEGAVREREEQLGRLVGGAMDAIVELDDRLTVTLLNAAAEKVFGCAADAAVGRPFQRFLAADSAARLATLAAELDARPAGERSLWIPGGLTALRADGTTFPAEATLSRFESRRRTFHTLVLRNVNERLEAERRIRSLTVETECLRHELQALRPPADLLGASEVMARVLRDVEQVAPTDATVLILGETGTGKELVARAIHARSSRRERPFVVINCAAIPAGLIESELFGHEAGAFTGATKRRVGRFALADGATLFLDEVGELPLEVQAKLLRVLQEGELAPVGSSVTRRVDVRIVAATNRDLRAASRDGMFREDLFYRLHVFPIEVPPLRARGDDVVLLAADFAERCARRMGRPLAPLSHGCRERLRAYEWPGNVRELQNVIERAVITARDGVLDLSSLLPAAPAARPVACDAAPDRILTVAELEALERSNLERALDASGWRIAGDRGAARLLGMHASTLTSRMKALRIQRPR